MQPVHRDRASASRSAGEVGHVQPAGIDPGRAARDDATWAASRRITGIQLGAALGRLLLGVVEQPRARGLGGTDPLEVEQHRRGDHERSGEAAAAGLVGAGDEPDAERAIEREQLAARAPSGASATGAATGPGLGGRRAVGHISVDHSAAGHVGVGHRTVGVPARRTRARACRSGPAASR